MAMLLLRVCFTGFDICSWENGSFAVIGHAVTERLAGVGSDGRGTYVSSPWLWQLVS